MRRDSETQPSGFTMEKCSAVILRARQLYPEVFGAHEQEALSRLFAGGAVLSPESLRDWQPHYEMFVGWDLHPLVYVKSESLPVAIGESGVMVAFMGPSASGKDAILDQQDNRLFTMVQTITTRPRAQRDKPRGRFGVEPRYKFMTPGEFQKCKDQEHFIETLPQGKFMYGTPADAVGRALERPEPIKIWRGELNGSVHMREWMAVHHPEVPFLSFFILPKMSLAEYCSWVEEKRGSEADWRFPKALWEIYVAGPGADVIIENPPDPTGIPREAGEATRRVFEELSQC